MTLAKCRVPFGPEHIGALHGNPDWDLVAAWPVRCPHRGFSRQGIIEVNRHGEHPDLSVGEHYRAADGDVRVQAVVPLLKARRVGAGVERDRRVDGPVGRGLGRD